MSFLPKTRIDIAVRNDQLDAALAAIEKSGCHRQDGATARFLFWICNKSSASAPASPAKMPCN